MNEDKGFALVTGASSGIGLAISRELAGIGYPLLMVSNQEKEIAQSAGETEKTFGVKTIPLYMDLAQPDSAQRLFDYCEENSIAVSVLVNNAGIFFFRDICATSTERINVMMNLHNLTPVMLCRLFAEKMKTQKRRGYILNMASIAGWMMMPGITMYSATKSFLRCFSRALRCELFDYGISITTVCPGAVATNLFGLKPSLMNLGMRLGIIITPEKLARNAVKKLLKGKAEYIPGLLLNRLFILIIKALPEFLIQRLKKAIDRKITKSART